MKKIISILLVAAIIVSALTLSCFAKNDSLKITVTTDTHLSCLADCGKLDPDAEQTYTKGMVNAELYYHTTLQGQMDCESTAIIKSMLKSFVASDSKYLLIAGDLTGGLRNSHIEMAKLLHEAEKQSGREIFVIVGNHDCDAESTEDRISADEFKEIYADFGYNEAVSRHSESASYAVDLNDEYRLLAIDSCVYGKDEGLITDSVMSWIENEVNKAKEDGVHLVAMMHHSLLSHFAVQPMIDNSEKIAEKFADWGIKFVFTGHIHANDISSAVSKNGNTVYDIQTGSLITSPNAYRNITFNGSKVDIKSEYVTSIDTADLPEGYTKEQLKKISTDFAGYSASFFEAGVCRWFNRNIGSAGKVGKKLKLDSDSPIYKGLDYLMLKVGDALAMPIYDDGSTPDEVDSIQEIAAIAGAELPESDYERCYQIAASLMGAFFHGDEETILVNNEWDLLFICIKSVLAKSVTEMMFGNTLGELYDTSMEAVTVASPYKIMFNVLVKVNYNLPLINRIVEAILDPLTDGITGDLSSPCDINVTLDGYGEASQLENVIPLTVFDKIINILKKVLVAFVGVK